MAAKGQYRSLFFATQLYSLLQELKAMVGSAQIVLKTSGIDS